MCYFGQAYFKSLADVVAKDEEQGHLAELYSKLATRLGALAGSALYNVMKKRSGDARVRTLNKFASCGAAAEFTEEEVDDLELLIIVE